MVAGKAVLIIKLQWWHQLHSARVLQCYSSASADDQALFERNQCRTQSQLLLCRRKHPGFELTRYMGVDRFVLVSSYSQRILSSSILHWDKNIPMSKHNVFSSNTISLDKIIKPHLRVKQWMMNVLQSTSNGTFSGWSETHFAQCSLGWRRCCL